MSWKRLPRLPWPLPATRNKTLKALKQLGLKLGNSQVKEVDGLSKSKTNQEEKNLKKRKVDEFFDSIIDQCRHTFTSGDISGLHSKIALGAGALENSQKIKSAGAMKAIRYMTGHGKQKVAEDLLMELSVTCDKVEEEDIDDVNAGTSVQYQKVFGLMLQDLLRRKEYMNVLQLSSRVIGLKASGSAPILSNIAIQAIFESAMHLGDKELLFKSWDVLIGDKMIGNGTVTNPSHGTFVAFLKACLVLDSLSAQQHIFGNESCAKRALSYAKRHEIYINNSIISMLFDHCRNSSDIFSVMELHLSSIGLDGLPSHSKDDRDWSENSMLNVLHYANSVKVTSKLVSSLIRALMRFGYSGEAFALLQYPRLKSGEAIPREYQNYVDEEPFNILMQHAPNIGGLWPIFKALEVITHAWRAPSKRSVELVLHKIAHMEDLNKKDILHDLLAVFKDCNSPFDMENKDVDSLKLDSVCMSDMSHIKIHAIWDIWRRYCLPYLSRKSIQTLIRSLHKAHCNDAYLRACLHSILLSMTRNELLSDSYKRDLRSEIVLVLLQDNVHRKDLALTVIAWLADKNVKLNQSAIEKCALALDSRERIAHFGNVQKLIKVAVISNSLTTDFQKNMKSSILEACKPSEENGPSEGGLDFPSQEKLISTIESKFKVLRSMKYNNVGNALQELKTIERKVRPLAEM